MSLDPVPRSRPLDLYHASACDDAPVSHGHRPNKGLRIIIADDHPVVLTGIEMVLSSFADFTCSVVARAENADELIHHLHHTPCDLVISDYAMPYGRLPDGLALMGYLKRRFASLPVIVITMLRNPALLQALLNIGVDSLFDKRSALSELKRAVFSTANGRRYLCPAFARILDAHALPPLGPNTPSVNLSNREIEVVRLFAQGLSGRQIAARLNRSEKPSAGKNAPPWTSWGSCMTVGWWSLRG
ncbi:response regulator [Pseudomonas umsongensis]|uniref:response regulator n=1 Tax=Pseudomonas umsongensis TaxID=198618 RepID=UPI003ED0E1D5